MKTLFLAALLSSVISVTVANSATLSFTAAEFNGDYVEIGSSLIQPIKSWNVALRAGESIISAVFLSSFGNTEWRNSGGGKVTVGGIEVASCDGPGKFCYEEGPEAITYQFSPDRFASLLGTVDLIFIQDPRAPLEGDRIRLGESRLVIETAVSAVPVPAGGALMLSALGLLGFGARRRSLQS